jgi:hypothetical protein
LEWVTIRVKFSARELAHMAASAVRKALHNFQRGIGNRNMAGDAELRAVA